MIQMSGERFDELVVDALDKIPGDLRRLMQNVAVFVAEEPEVTSGQLLGRYEGTPLPERGDWYSGVLPDRITIYMVPILRISDTTDDVINEVAVTVAHEVAHHFGISDERLEELGRA